MANIVTVEEGIRDALLKANVSKYRLAKSLGVEPIMIDKYLTGKTKTLRREAATILHVEFGVKVSELFINERKPKQVTMSINENNELVV